MEDKIDLLSVANTKEIKERRKVPASQMNEKKLYKRRR